LIHKGRVVGRSSTFEKLPKQKQACLKVGSGGWAIRCVAPRCKGNLGMKLRNQVVQIDLRFDCRGIGQPVERCPNNQQAQQTCRDLGSHSLVAPAIIRPERAFLTVIGSGSKGIPCSYVARNSMGGSLRQESIYVQRNGNRPRRLAAAVVVDWSETSEVRRGKPNLARETTGIRCGK
jgi:hypothetical protein